MKVLQVEGVRGAEPACYKCPDGQTSCRSGVDQIRRFTDSSAD
jgi:hypothetical protein